ncbi:MAG: BatD family protein [Bacteroidota bacterium]
MRTSVLLIISLLLGLFAVPFIIQAQNGQELTFTAHADAKEVYQDTYFELTFTLHNAQSSNFTPPDFTDFKVLSGPQRRYQTNITDGRRTDQASYTYQLQALKTGILKIGTASIIVGDSTLWSKPVQVQVLEGQSQPANGKPEVLLLPTLKQDQVYLGQPLILDYILSSRSEIRTLRLVSEPNYEGFNYRQSHHFDKQGFRELRDGVEYSSGITRRVILYPKVTGTINISPMQIGVGVYSGDQQSSSELTNSPALRRFPVSCEEVQIKVAPLPEPQPKDFTGIIGDFSLQATLNQEDITTDDTIRLQLTFEGYGDPQRISEVKPNLPAELELLDQKVLEEKYLDRTTGMIARKRLEYLLIPKQNGNFTIQPQFVIFDIKSNTYEPLRANALSLTVRQSNKEKY